MTKPCERDLYFPIRLFLEAQGYTVKSEINDCDVVAVNSEQALVIVEMKTVLNVKLLLQAVVRKEMTDDVYIAVPVDTPLLRKDSKQVIKLLRLLGIGLLVVDLTKNRVLALLDPGEYRPRKRKDKQTRLLKAFRTLVGDPNDGGRDGRKKYMTVYRQQALDVAEYLMENGQGKASVIRDALQEPKTWRILNANVYGWFEKVEKGIYTISPRGKREYREWRQADS